MESTANGELPCFMYLAYARSTVACRHVSPAASTSALKPSISL